MYFSVIKIMLKQLIENKKLVFMFWWINVGHQWKIGIKSSPNVSYRQKLIADKAEDKVRYGSFLIHSNCKNSATKCKWNTLLAPMESLKGMWHRWNGCITCMLSPTFPWWSTTLMIIRTTTTHLPL